MKDAAPPRPGLLGAFRALGDGLLASVEDRVALVSLELQEEKFRLIRSFFWISAVVFSGTMAIGFASLAFVYLFRESARLAVLGGLALFYSGALIALLLAFRAYLRRQPRPFAATLQELETDRACIRNGS